ncbi:MAG: TGS domain-containing protein [Cytophagaceae bacterium]|nr:MAG: TGS domain-containing protein [Cytophagaceae bacterium]
MMVWQYSLTGRQCNSIHKTIVEGFKHAIVYGKSVKHQPQRVGLSHELADEDIGMCPLTI